MGDLGGDFIQNVQHIKQTVPGLISAAFLFFSFHIFRGKWLSESGCQKETELQLDIDFIISSSKRN